MIQFMEKFNIELPKKGRKMAISNVLCVEPISIENQNLISMLQQSMVVLQSIKMCISFLVLGMDILQEKFWPIKCVKRNRKIGLTEVKKKLFKYFLIIGKRRYFFGDHSKVRQRKILQDKSLELGS